MFDVGFWEILLILVLALVIIGPERLPAAARKAGFFVGKARRYIEGVRSDVEQELDVNEFKRLLHNQEVQINELQQQIKSGVEDIKADLPDSSVLPDIAELNNNLPQPYKDSLSASLKNEVKDAPAENKNSASSLEDKQA